jgi:hypothetical protein
VCGGRFYRNGSCDKFKMMMLSPKEEKVMKDDNRRWLALPRSSANFQISVVTERNDGHVCEMPNCGVR